jgi:hypothetical protein
MTQIDADTKSESANCKSIGLGSEPLTVLRSGFIQIQSVKSVVKNQGFGSGSAAPVSFVFQPKFLI